MKSSLSLLSSLFCLLLIWTASCKKDPDPAPGGGTTNPGSGTTNTGTTKSSAKAITAFAFSGLNPAITATIDATAKTISATVTSGTDVTKLVPTITVSDKATVSPASGVAQDFSKAVTYTVTAEDGTTQAYVANVTVPAVVSNSVNQTVFMEISGYMTALDSQTGKVKWSGYSNSLEAGAGEPIYLDGKVYYYSTSDFIASDALTGKRLFSVKSVGGQFSSNYVSTYANGLIYIQNDSYFLIGIDPTTGTEKWKCAYKNAMPLNPTFVDGVGYSTLKNVAKDSYGFDIDGLAAIDLASGKLKWTKGIGSDNNPAVVDGIVYVSSRYYGGSVYAINASSGEYVWKKESLINDNGIDNATAVTVVNSILYTRLNDKLFALNTKTGDILWQHTFSTKDATIRSSNSAPFVYNGTVFIGYNDGKVYAFNSTSGTKKWEFQTGGKVISSSPVVVDDIVYISADKVFALDANTGSVKWSYTSPSSRGSYGYFGACVVDKNGKSYYPSTSGMIQ